MSPHFDPMLHAAEVRRRMVVLFCNEDAFGEHHCDRDPGFQDETDRNKNKDENIKDDIINDNKDDGEVENIDKKDDNKEDDDDNKKNKKH